MYLQPLPFQPLWEPTARQRCYAGEISMAAANSASAALAHIVQQQIMQHTHTQQWEAAQAMLHAPSAYAAMQPVRTWLQHSAEAKDAVAEWLASLLGDTDAFAIDYPRLRMVPPAHATSPALVASALFAPHRDVWYGNPAAQINLWMPLHTLAPNQSLGIYPQQFGQATPNNSADFNYPDWVQQVGWQGSNTAPYSAFPTCSQPKQLPQAQWVDVPVAATLCFSAQHLHGTQSNTGAHTRLSIDLRCVHRADAAEGKGAPNVDNAARGNAMADYHYLSAKAAA